MLTAMYEQIAAEIGAKAQQVTATVAMLDDGATVPFIARYRKEVTGGLDDTQLRKLQERLVYLREMEDRREVRQACSRWPTVFTTTPRWTRNWKLRNTSMPTMRSPMQKQRWTAPVTF